MCGIAGRYHAQALPVDPCWHSRADSLLAHRGPDGSGHYLDDRCELVHRRLAIVDLSLAGQQPMSNEDNSLQLVFNGEIYNHRELRALLVSKGHKFKSSSDTEVIVHLYEEFGIEAVAHLRGMFAFGLYDQNSNSLLLARDRFGIKPLYYAIVGGQLVFASEIKAITAIENFSGAIDRQACYDYLSLGYVPEPLTGFEGVHALPAATLLVVNSFGLKTTRYYELNALPDDAKTLSKEKDAIAEALLEAIKYQRIADVPVAALLSGGIDSSLVVGAYKRATEFPPRTFNVRFPDADYDETSVALAVAQHCNTQHETIDLRDWTVTPESITDLLLHFDQPFADTSFIPMYSVARAIRERGIICTLSGDGGDEAFGGYARFWRANALAKINGLPSWIKQILEFSGGKLARVTRDRGRQLEKAVKLAREGWNDSALLLAGLSSYQSEKQKQELVPAEAREQLVAVDRHFDGFAPSAPRDLEELSQRMTVNLFSVGLPSDMLRKVDMMSMRASIEVRVPFLDERMVELGLSLPHRLKTDGKIGKLVLRELAKEWLPDQVAKHRKQGFSIPLDVMVNDRFYTMLEDYLLSPTARTLPLLNRGVTRRWLQLFRYSNSGKRDGRISRGGLYQRIIILLSLELWMRQYKLSW